MLTRQRPARSHLLALLAAIAASALYLHWTPPVPDLAAQVARANVARAHGITAWWAGWFGGLGLPDYSVLAPKVMATVGVRATAVLAVVGAAAGVLRLTALSVRPRIAAATWIVAIAANALDGRVTFSLGVAAAVWALVAVRACRYPEALALTVATYFSSPLAAMFLGLILLAIAIATARLRWIAGACAACTVLLAGAMALFFPGTGTMPFHPLDAVPTALAAVIIVVMCHDRTVRVAALLLLASVPVFLIVPTAVGANITLLCWLCAVPVLVSCARASPRVLAAMATLLAAWPIGDLAGQLAAAGTPSAYAAFYRPLERELVLQQASATGPLVHARVEVIDTANHWGSTYLTTFALARGWDRQADNALNPLFYKANALDSDTYRAWLDQLAVGWVALPAAPLDYASAAEGALVAGGIPYLQLTWSDRDWRLYRVIDPTPLVEGANIISATSSGLVLDVPRARTVSTRLRWSPNLTVLDLSDPGSVGTACLRDADGWVTIDVERPETLQLSTDFDLINRPDAGGSCGSVPVRHP